MSTKKPKPHDFEVGDTVRLKDELIGTSFYTWVCGIVSSDLRVMKIRSFDTDWDLMPHPGRSVPWQAYEKVVSPTGAPAPAPAPEPSYKYFVYVAGAGGPTCQHDSAEAAEAELRRILTKGKAEASTLTGYVLRIEKILHAKPKWEIT